MQDEYFWALFGGGFIMFWAILITWTQQLRAIRRLRERELLHKERALAFERGISLPEEGGAAAFSPALLQRLILAFGLTCLFAGAGLSLAFCLMEDAEVASFWTLGLIPAMIGIGLLFYSWLSRRLPAGIPAE